MTTIEELEQKVYGTLVDNGVASEFCELMKLQAEMIMRNLPGIPAENRQMAEGQILHCFAISDGVMHALETSEAEAKVKEAEGFREYLKSGFKQQPPTESFG